MQASYLPKYTTTHCYTLQHGLVYAKVMQSILDRQNEQEKRKKGGLTSAKGYCVSVCENVCQCKWVWVGVRVCVCVCACFVSVRACYFCRGSGWWTVYVISCVCVCVCVCGLVVSRVWFDGVFLRSMERRLLERRLLSSLVYFQLVSYRFWFVCVFLWFRFVSFGSWFKTVTGGWDKVRRDS